MVERRVDWEFLFVALVLTATIMVGMFYMGQELSDQKVDSLTQQMERLTVERESQDLSRRLAENLPTNNCEALNAAVRQTIADVESLRKQVATYEQSQKIDNPDFKLLKKQYTNLLIEYWLTTKKIEERCGSNIVKVLYIYADQRQCERCKDQGTVLTKYRQQYDDQLLVFPLDSTLDLPTVNVLIDAYNIDQYPALIVQGDAYTGFKGHDAFGTLLDGYLNRNATGTGMTQAEPS